MGSAPLSPTLREIKQLLCVQNVILYFIKQIDSMLPCICPLIDRRERQNVVRTERERQRERELKETQHWTTSEVI